MFDQLTTLLGITPYINNEHEYQGTVGKRCIYKLGSSGHEFVVTSKYNAVYDTSPSYTLIIVLTHPNLGEDVYLVTEYGVHEEDVLDTSSIMLRDFYNTQVRQLDSLTNILSNL